MVVLQLQEKKRSKQNISKTLIEETELLLLIENRYHKLRFYVVST